MDRRGLRRTKAAHINPIPLFAMAIILYVTNLVFWEYDAPWWSFPAAFLLTLVTGFSIYLIQSRYAENSSPIYFAVYLFLLAIVPQMAIYRSGMFAAFCIALAFVFTIKFICEDKRRDYIACTAFSCILAAILTPSLLWMLPLFWIILLEESDKKIQDSAVFTISSAISGAIIFGTLYLFLGFDSAVDTARNWQIAITQFSTMDIKELAFTSGLFSDWKSTEFAGSFTKSLVILDGIIITAVYLSRKDRLKSDDAIISKVCLLIAIFSIALNYFYTDEQATYWTIIAAVMSVPTTHFLSSEGKHILITIFFVVAFLCAVLGLIPILELL